MSGTQKQKQKSQIMDYNHPKRSVIGKLRFLAWRFHNFLQGTFSLGMLEVWEQLLVGLMVLILSSLLWYSLYYHFPGHVRSSIRRASYYLFGSNRLGGKSGFESSKIEL